MLFWSLFTAHAWNLADVGYCIFTRSFYRRSALWYIGHTFEAPPVSLALVFVLTNLDRGSETKAPAAAPGAEPPAQAPNESDPQAPSDAQWFERAS